MNAPCNGWVLAADAMLLAHFAFVAFVVLGFAYIWAGRAAGWKSAGNPRFRVAHLAAMGIVLAQSLLGAVCPLTKWENDLRVRGGQGEAYETTFMQEWLHRLLFFDLDEKAFMVIYAVFFALIVATFRFVPVDWKRGRRKDGGAADAGRD